MRIVYVPTIKCKACQAEIRFNPSQQPPEHLHLKKVSFVTVCPNLKCKRLATADPDEVRWVKKDLDEETPERLPF